eukprot:RCo026204
MFRATGWALKQYGFAFKRWKVIRDYRHMDWGKKPWTPEPVTPSEIFPKFTWDPGLVLLITLAQSGSMGLYEEELLHSVQPFTTLEGRALLPAQSFKEVLELQKARGHLTETPLDRGTKRERYLL